MRKVKVISLCFIVLVMVGCMSAAQHAESLHSAADRNMTVGTVQAKIYKGMSQADVAEALGSPNIVTNDGVGDDTWIYDKVATEASYSSDRGGSSGLAGVAADVGSTLLLGGLGGSYSKSAGAYASTQRTLTVVIKFDASKKVKAFSYHSSKF